MIPARWRLVAFAALVAGLTSAHGQSLRGRIVYMSGGHGWTFTDPGWSTQRGVSFEMVEDYGNLDQMNFFAAYCLNAGATVVPFRPLGYQTNEVVVDNDSPNVSFVGTWSNSAATQDYYGTPGDVPYRFATLAVTETATASYTPTIPAAGFYPVYAWASSGANRGRQLYRVRHTGGEAQVRIPHEMVGNGWIYLGNYYFGAGSNSVAGAVVISNLREAGSAAGSVVIADAVRFGNGMGPSGFAREEECSRYWVQAGIGVGDLESIYDGGGDDGSDNVGTPPRMAAHMNREQSGSRYDRVLISFHSNGGGGAARGTLALHNGNHPGTFTTNQLALARWVGQEVNDDLVAQSIAWEHPWHNRGTSVTLSRSDIAFGEINNVYIDDEFDATIIEVGFHDNVQDAELMRDPRVRQAAARASYQGMIRYFNQFGGVPLTFLPEPPGNVRAIAQPDGTVRVQWAAPGAGGGSAQGYVVQISTNGYGFSPLGGGTGTFLTISNLLAETDWFFRVASTNAAGESLPSEVVGCRLAAFDVPRVLYVNGYDRLDRFLAPSQTAGSMTFDRCQPRRMNAFDYIVQHGAALGRNGVPYDSCQNEAIISGLVRLTNYAAVIWGLGNESTADDTFNASEQIRVAEYLDRGGRMFVSGSEIAWDLASAGPSFLSNYLHAVLENDDAGTYNFSALPSGVFAGNPAARFDNGTFGAYDVQYPDRLTPVSGATSTIVYAGNTAAAALQYADSSTGSRLIFFGFPFETITTASAREVYMLDVLKFFDIFPRPIILTMDGIPGNITIAWRAVPGKRYRVQYKANLAAVSWSSLSGDVVATSHAASKVDVTPAAPPAQRFYRVMLVEP